MAIKYYKVYLRVPAFRDRLYWLDRYVFMAVDDEKGILGGISYEFKGDSAFIYLILVKACFRGKGYGTKLLRKFEEFVSDRGAKRIIVCCPRDREMWVKNGYELEPTGVYAYKKL